MWFQVIAKDMIAKGHSGSIVNICSLGIRAPLPMVSIFSMTKSIYRIDLCCIGIDQFYIC